VPHKCANPSCPSLFRSLNLGKLFLLDTDSSVAGASGTSPAESQRAVSENVSSRIERCLMNHSRTPLCAICGQERSASQPRFLIAENIWEDKLTSLHWNESMASRAGIQLACSIDHVEELVMHWMTTGKLDHPFARTALGAAGWRRLSTPGGSS
jgi:hypothetical protein